jgi:hypothetical protein
MTVHALKDQLAEESQPRTQAPRALPLPNDLLHVAMHL